MTPTPPSKAAMKAAEKIMDHCARRGVPLPNQYSLEEIIHAEMQPLQARMDGESVAPRNDKLRDEVKWALAILEDVQAVDNSEDLQQIITRLSTALEMEKV